MAVIIFDLDDTLYNERDFVFSGYREVSKFLSLKLNIDSTKIYKKLKEYFFESRDKVFDRLLDFYGIKNKQLVKNCLKVYRKHKPEITLSPEAINCLERLKIYPIYIVTDGNKLVQNNKIKALKLEERVKKVFITHRYGLKHAKPSPYCFNKIQNLEAIDTNKIIYIADNPNKDFIGIKPLGFKTIRVMQGCYKDLTFNDKYEAHIKIESLNELTLQLISDLTT